LGTSFWSDDLVHVSIELKRACCVFAGLDPAIQAALSIFATDQPGCAVQARA
jgi:hypothetical protein